MINAWERDCRWLWKHIRPDPNLDFEGQMDGSGKLPGAWLKDEAELPR